MQVRRIRSLAPLIATGAALAGASSAAAAPPVTTTADSGPGSLRAALAASLTGDTIDVPASAEAYHVSSGDLQVEHALTIRGAGARSTVVDAGGTSRVFYISNGSGDVTFSGLSIVNGNGVGASASGVGGGIYAGSSANVTLDGVRLSGNTANSVGGQGGGILVNDSLTLRSTLVTGNSATSTNGIAAFGGGIYSGGPLTIENSTITDNTAGGTVGGGIGGGVRTSSSAPVTIRNSTLFANRALPGSMDATTHDGASLANGNTNIHLRDSLIAGGVAVDGNCDNPVTSDGGNLEDTDTCGLGSNDRKNTPPQLGALVDNGGQTDTLAPNPGSPAIDSPLTSSCTTRDQREVARDAICDIGAFEAIGARALVGNANEITQTSARLFAAVTANAGSATYRFEYGTMPSFGTLLPVDTLGPGVLPIQVSRVLTDLSPNTHYFYRVSGQNTWGTDSQGEGSFTTLPLPDPGLLSASLLRTRFRVGSGATAIDAARRRRPAPRGTAFRYRISQAAEVRIKIQRLLPGRRVGRTCRRPTRALRRKPRCTRVLTQGTLRRHHTRAGRFSTPFSGRIARRRLPAGSYRATLQAISTGALRASRTRVVRFTIVAG